MNSSKKDIDAMKYTQPKMVRVIDGLKGGKGKMVVFELSQRDKDLLAEQAAKQAAQAAE